MYTNNHISIKLSYHRNFEYPEDFNSLIWSIYGPISGILGQQNIIARGFLNVSPTFAETGLLSRTLQVSVPCVHVTLTLPSSSLLMMTSSNGNIFRVTGHLCGKLTGHQWIPRTKASDAELFVVFFADLHVNTQLNKQSCGLRFETPSPHYDVTVMCLA